jgi:hypothetical protein
MKALSFSNHWKKILAFKFAAPNAAPYAKRNVAPMAGRIRGVGRRPISR